jgi:hypothetical protein
MKLDFSAIQGFLSFLAGETELQAVLEHPAYQTVFLHAAHFGDGLTAKDVELASQSQPSPFYGLKDSSTNLAQIKNLCRIIEARQTEWLDLAESALRRVLPYENTHDISIHPILGYDMGIGFNGMVCMNLNITLYLSHPEEFLYFMIHECTHVLYERSHTLSATREVNTPGDWRKFYADMIQYEGFAVYIPFGLRQERRVLTHSDYQVLVNPVEMDEHIHAFLDVYASLKSNRPMPREERLERLFDSQRLPYRVGAEILRRLEEREGVEALTRAFYMDGVTFIESYKNLIED